ncbi:MAG: PKD domain-containing protein [Bacteroidota bacterium]
MGALASFFLLPLIVEGQGITDISNTPNSLSESPVMLLTGDDDYGFFADYGAPAPSRLYVTFLEPGETLRIGLAVEYDADGTPMNNSLGSKYIFRIRRDNGLNGADPIVHPDPNNPATPANNSFEINSGIANILSYGTAGSGQYNVDTTIHNQLIYQFSPDTPGDYYIEFDDIIAGSDGDNNSRVSIPFWDFDLVDAGGNSVDGRVWSRNWAFRTPVDFDILNDEECVWNRAFDGVLYSYTTDQFVSRIDFNESGMQALSFNVAFNSTGPGADTLSLEERRKSIPGDNATTNAGEHQIFLAEPDPEAFPSGECGGPPSLPTLTCSAEEEYCIEVTVGEVGQVELILDFNRNNIVDSESEDVVLVFEFTDPNNLTACIPWDGIKGDGTPAGPNDTLNLVLNYAQGIQHWAVFDAEFMKEGFCIETVRPLCSDINIGDQLNLYWDDRNLPATDSSGTTAPKDGRNGCTCDEEDCRTWVSFFGNQTGGVCNTDNIRDDLTRGYGDKTTLNTWWFANNRQVITNDVPISNFDIAGPDSICAGDTTTFAVVEPDGTEGSTYIWTGPGVDSITTASIDISLPGEYCLYLTDNLGCTRFRCKTLAIVETPEETIAYPDISAICPGELVTLTPDGSLDGLVSISWTPTTGLDDSTSFTPSLIATETTTYIAEIGFGNLGCTYFDTVTVDPNIEPIADFEFNSDCNGVDINFISTCVNEDSVFWDFGDLTVVTDTSSLDNPTYVYPDVGTYIITLLAFTSEGCVDTFIQPINVVDENPIMLEVDVNGTIVGPDSDIGTPDNPLISCEPDVTLTPVPGDGLTFNYLNMAGDTIASGATYMEDLSGMLFVTVEATDSNGCVKELDVVVEGGPVNTEVPDTVIGCLQDPVMLEVINLDPNDTLTHLWEPAELFDDPTSATPTFVGEPGEYEVMVTSTNQYGCTETVTSTVVVIDETDTLSFTSEVDCDGQTVAFTNTSTVGFGYEWDFGDGNSSNESDPIHIYDMPGTYQVTLDLEYEQDCIEPFTMEVVVPDLVLDAGLTVELGDCADGAATLNFMDASTNNSGGPITYDWTFNPGMPATSTDADPSVVVMESGPVNVTMTITSADSCVSTIDTVITITIPEVNPPDTVVVCPGDTAFLNPNPDTSLTYTWMGEGGFMSNDPNPGVLQTGQYTVATGPNEMDMSDLSCTDMDTVYVVGGDVPDPVINGPNGDVSVNNDGILTIPDPGIIIDDNRGGEPDMITLPFLATCGETISLEAVDDNPGTTFTYTIFPDGTEIITDNPAEFNLEPCDTLVVLLTATSVDLCTAYDTLILISNEIEVTPEPAEVTVCAGQDTTLSVNVTGKIDGVTYEWSGGPINGPADGASISITTPDEGTVDYTVVATNAEGCQDSTTVTVTVIPFMPNDYDDTVLACFNEPTVLPGGDIVDGYTYEWAPEDGLDLSDPNNPTVTLTEDATYTVTITDPATECFTVDTIMVTVAPEIGLEVMPADTFLCEAGTVTFTAGTMIDGAEISWYSDPDLMTELGMGMTLDFPVTEPGTYTVYTLAVDPETDCRDTVSSTVTFEPLDDGRPEGPVNVCAGDPSTANIFPNGMNPDYTYTYDPEGLIDEMGNYIGTTDTVITVTTTDPTTMCSVMDEIEINYSDIMLELSPADTTLCMPGELTLMATSNEEDAVITWYSDPELTMEIGSGGSIVYDADSEGVFTVFAQAIDPETQCPVTVSTTVTVDMLDDGLPTTSLDVCADDDDSRNLFPGGRNENYIYTYDPAELVDADGNFIGMSDATITVTVFDPETMCEVMQMVNVTYNDLTGLMIEAVPPTVFLPDGTTEVTVTGCDDCTYQWSTDNGGFSGNTDGATVIGVPTDEGTANYAVTVTRNGCISVPMVPVVVERPDCVPDRFYLPNAFTPNGDNRNDVLRVRSNFLEEVEGFDLMIFNRWGQQVYRSFDPFDSWDGTCEGDDLEPDVYGYCMTYLCPGTQERVMQQGNVTILR